MRSDYDVQIFTFRSEKWIGFLMQSKSIGIKSYLRIRWPKPSDFGPKSDDSAHRILKSKNGIGISSCRNVTEQSLVQQQYEVQMYD